MGRTAVHNVIPPFFLRDSAAYGIYMESWVRYTLHSNPYSFTYGYEVALGKGRIFGARLPGFEF